MKKLFTTILSFMFILSMSAVAFATEVEGTPFSGKYPEVLTLQKTYNLAWNQGVAPVVDEMTFDITPDSIKEREGTPPAFSGPLTVTVPGGTGSINFPVYTNVGTYVYKISENDGSTAGVYYNAPDMTLEVTVVRDGDGFKVFQYAIRVGDTKTSEVKNDYKAANLLITKKVTGNFGDKEKNFTVEVTLTKPENKTVGSVITYPNGSIAPSAWENVNAITIQISVKDGSLIEFKNIPEGFTYIVQEESTDYTVTYNNEAIEKFESEISQAAQGVVIVNNLEAEVDTGITLDSIPYIMILSIAVLGSSVVLLRKRKNFEV